MKGLKSRIILIFLVSFFACEPPVTFNEPQPADTDNSSKFPKRLQGEYISLEDTSLLIISDSLIQRVYNYNYKMHPNQLDSTARLSGDTVLDLISNKKTPVKFDGDSFVAHFHYIDTIFQVNGDNVIKKFKGYYFLNTRYGKASWGVKKVSVHKGQLVIGDISTKLDIDNLKEITETSTDTVIPYEFSVTKRQFKEFIKKDGFSDSEVFVKQRKE